jgi:hypothetical protein
VVVVHPIADGELALPDVARSALAWAQASQAISDIRAWSASHRKPACARSRPCRGDRQGLSPPQAGFQTSSRPPGPSSSGVPSSPGLPPVWARKSALPCTNAFAIGSPAARLW